MTLLFDSHALLWASVFPNRLGKISRQLISDGGTTLLVSAASLWEISIKVRAGRLDWAREFEAALPEVLHRADYQLLDIPASVCLRAARMPGAHSDPFDRLIAAQALELDIPVLSLDTALDVFGVRRIW